MATVIKASDRNRGIHGVAFNFDDLAGKATDYLEKIRGEARTILETASREADQIRRQAEADGRQAAQVAAQKTVDDRIAAQMQSALPALKQAVDQIAQSRHAWLAHWERQAIELAARMAEKLLRQELSSRPQATLTWVREALELAAGQSEILVRMHPEDRAAFGEQASLLAREIAGLGEVQVVADPMIARGGCRVDTRYGSIDQSIEARLARLVEELS